MYEKREKQNREKIKNIKIWEATQNNKMSLKCQNGNFYELKREKSSFWCGN